MNCIVPEYRTFCFETTLVCLLLKHNDAQFRQQLLQREQKGYETNPI